MRLWLPSLLIAGLFGCEAYTSPNPDYSFHATFVRGLAHASTGCDACHVLAPTMQRELGLDIPPATTGNWVTKVDGACTSCHPFTAELGAIPAVSECIDRTSPVYEHEYCRFDNYHGRNFNPGNGGCTGADGQTCHAVSDASFKIYSQPVDTDDTDDTDVPPPNNPHTLGALAERFPLVGGHLAVATDCANSACHPNGPANAADARGNSNYCGSCHGRVRDGTVATHYPPPRPGWTDEKERDCAACHVRTELDGTILWPNAWNDAIDVPINHNFLVPHNTVEDWDLTPAIPRSEPAWKRQCWSCHNQWSLSSTANPADSQDGTSQNALPSSLYLDYELTNDRNNCTDGCHATVQPTHGGSASCVSGGCHTTSGPDDLQ